MIGVDLQHPVEPCERLQAPLYRDRHGAILQTLDIDLGYCSNRIGWGHFPRASACRLRTQRCGGARDQVGRRAVVEKTFDLFGRETEGSAVGSQLDPYRFPFMCHHHRGNLGKRNARSSDHR